MASFGIIHHFAGGTKEQYENTIAVVHPDGGAALPPGQTYHAAGPSDSGWLVVAMWDSEASWEKFRDGTLGPALGSLTDGLPGPPEETTFHISAEQT